MSWIGLLGSSLALAALVLAPGAVVLRAIGLRGMAVLGAAAPVTLGVLGIATAAFELAGVPWRAGTVLTLLGALSGAAVLASWYQRRRGGGAGLNSPGPSGAASNGAVPFLAVAPPPLSPRQRALLALSLVAATAILVIPFLVAIGHPDAPLQQWDAVFHQGAVVVVRETASATPLGSLGPLYGGATAAPYYPTLWHAVVAVLPGSVPLASNAAIIVLGVGVWLLGVTGAVRELIRGRFLPTALAPLLAATFIAYPAVQLTLLAQHPGGLATALLPGTLLLALRCSRSLVAGVGVRPGAARTWVLLAATVIAAAGTVAAHGSAVFSLLVLAGPLLVTTVAGWVRRRRWARAWHARLAALVVAAGLVAAPFVLARVPFFAGVMGFERAGGWSHLTSAMQVLLDRTLAYTYPGESVWHLPVTVLTVAGVVLALRRREHRWLVAGYLVALALATLAAGPSDASLRWLAGFWYTQAGRIAPIAAIAAIALAAYAADAGVRWLAPRIRGRSGGDARTQHRVAVGVVTAVIVATALVRLPLQHAVALSAYDPDHLAWGTMATTEELAMMARLSETLPQDALVIGDPFNGSALLPPVAGVDVVFRQLGRSTLSEPEAVLADRLREIGYDPAVCEAIAELGVTHLYQDTATAEEGAKVDERTSGMRDVDVSSGFELVDSAGSAAIYRIELCG